MSKSQSPIVASTFFPSVIQAVETIKQAQIVLTESNLSDRDKQELQKILGK